MKTRAILVTLEKIHGVDVGDLLYLVGTGRLVKDYELMNLLGCQKLSNLYDELNDYLRFFKPGFDSVSIEQLVKGKWITNKTKHIAKEIIKLITEKYRTKTA